MANKKRKRKIIYHRLIGVIAVFVLAVYLLIGVGMKVYESFFTTDDKSEEKASTKVENKENKKIVVIDAGHGGYDPGSEASNGLYEKDITLEIALATGKYIEANNDDVLVVYTREDDDYYWTTSESQDLQYRVNLAVDNEALLFLSIHLNANDESNEIRGHETWVSLTGATNEAFAYAVDEQLNALNYNECRGVKDEAQSPLMILNRNPIPSVLVELGYINNAEDLAYITSQQGVKGISEALAKAMLNTLETIK